MADDPVVSDRTAATPSHERRPMSSARAVALAAAALLMLALSIAWQLRARATEARLVSAVPDAILADPALLAYALPRGRGAFEQHCASCHGRDAQGDSSRGVPRLTDDDWLYGSGRVAEIERTVLYGIRSGHPKTWNLADMPGFAKAEPYKAYKMQPLTPGDIDDVIAYLANLRGTPAAADAVERGGHVYHKNGFCFDCHGQDAKGDPAIGAPDLIDDIWLYGDGSDASERRSIEAGLAGDCPAWIGRLPPATVRAIAVYVAVSAHPPSKTGPSKVANHE
jgi:cytochrome c oxidase cbb3-type subunit 3